MKYLRKFESLNGASGYIREFFEELGWNSLFEAGIKKDENDDISRIIVYNDDWTEAAKINIIPLEDNVKIEFMDINELDDHNKLKRIERDGYEKDPLYTFMITLGYDMKTINSNMKRYLVEKIGFIFHVKLEDITLKKYTTNKNALQFDL